MPKKPTEVKKPNKSKNGADLDKIQALKEKYINYFSALPIQKLGAGYIGRDENTIIRWKKEDPTFADQVTEAESLWAAENAKRVKSREWLLERVMKNHFSARTEVTGAEGKDLFTNASEDKLKEIIKKGSKDV